MPLDALPDYFRYVAETEITNYLTELRTREEQRRWLNGLLVPMGWRVTSLPNWRGEIYS